MRNLRELDKFRLREQAVRLWGWEGDSTCGAFSVPSPIDQRPLRIVASGGEGGGLGWDHVSVSREKRCPNWAEMEHVKRLFFRDDETAMQLHVPANEHINCHPYCLHLWRPVGAEIPKPPSAMVGPPARGHVAREADEMARRKLAHG